MAQWWSRSTFMEAEVLSVIGLALIFNLVSFVECHILSLQHFVLSIYTVEKKKIHKWLIVLKFPRIKNDPNNINKLKNLLFTLNWDHHKWYLAFGKSGKRTPWQGVILLMLDEIDFLLLVKPTRSWKHDITVFYCVVGLSGIWATFKNAGITFFMLKHPHSGFCLCFSSCSRQNKQNSGGQCGGLIRTKVCIHPASVWQKATGKRMWNAPLRPKHCVGILLQLIHHHTLCNLMSFFFCVHAVRFCATSLHPMFVSLCVQIMDSDNYIHRCHTFGAIYYPFTAVTRRSSTMWTAAQNSFFFTF